MDACNSSSSASCTVRFASHCAFIPAPCKKSKGASTPSRSDSPAPSVSGTSPLSPTKTKARVTTKAVSIPLHKLSLKLPLPLVEFGPLSPPNTPTSTPAGFGSPRSEFPAQRSGSPAPPPVPPKPATPTKSCLRAPRLQPVKKRPTTPRRASMPLPFAPMQLVQEVKPVPGRTLGEIEVVPVECTLAPLARRRKPRLAGILRLAPRELEESPEEAELRALRAHELKGCCAQCASACTASALQAEQWTLGARRAWAAYTFGEHMAPAAPAPAGHLFSVDEVDLLRRRSQEPIIREVEASATAIVVTDEEGGQIATEPHSRQVSGESSLSSSSGSLSSHSTDSLASIGSATLTSPPTSPPCSPPQCLPPPLSFSSSPLPSPLSSSSAISSPALSTDGFPLSSSPCVPPKASYRPSVADDEDDLFPLPARKCSPKLPCPRSPVKARRASAICAMDRVVDMSTWKDKEGERLDCGELGGGDDARRGVPDLGGRANHRTVAGAQDSRSQALGFPGALAADCREAIAQALVIDVGESGSRDAGEPGRCGAVSRGLRNSITRAGVRCSSHPAADADVPSNLSSPQGKAARVHSFHPLVEGRSDHGWHYL
ncbi:hypothetical protein EV122DRAFT_266867, partial [Schizophyllum commune]